MIGLIVLLGIWAGLVPFVGPYFHYAYTPNSAWTYTTGRFWLEILPGVGAMLGGLIVLVSSNRPFAIFGAWLAAEEAVRRGGRVLTTALLGFIERRWP